jgi:GMP synthase (glutamine-hydrolysing)
VRFRLLQAREPDEIVAREEHEAFAERLGVPLEAIEVFDLLSGRATFDRVTRDVDVVLVGGSGRFGVGDRTPWMPSFVDTMGELAAAQFPTFASCFGFQALVVALGEPVLPDPDGSEVGTYELDLTEDGRGDPLFGSLPPRFRAQLGHKDRAMALPRGATHLAGSARCPYQALRVGAKVYATQFHPELTGPTNRLRFERYVREYGATFAASAPVAPDEMFLESPESSDLLRRFVEVVL